MDSERGTFIKGAGTVTLAGAAGMLACTPSEAGAGPGAGAKTVPGERRQHSNTSDMIFKVATIIRYASQHCTLKQGDIFFNGTPEGVIFGMPPEKQVWLKAGDKICTCVEKLGKLKIRLA